MPVEQKPLLPEVNFLPPLEMILCFFERKPAPGVKQEVPPAPAQPPVMAEQAVEKLIEKLHKTDR